MSGGYGSGVQIEEFKNPSVGGCVTLLPESLMVEKCGIRKSEFSDVCTAGLAQ